MISFRISPSAAVPTTREKIANDIEQLLGSLGSSEVYSNPYDTGWIARLTTRFPDTEFEGALAWLRRHQWTDGSWGSEAVHYHDRVISTLSAITALKFCGDPADKELIERGVDFLWQISGRLHYDANDTIGFPVLAVPLVNEANQLGLDVPRDLYHDVATIEKKLNMLSQNSSKWRYTSMAFSLEAIRGEIPDTLDFLEANASVGISPAATASLILYSPNTGLDEPLSYLRDIVRQQGDGGAPNFSPVEIFQATWALNFLRVVGAVTPDHPEVQRVLAMTWRSWSQEKGIGPSQYFSVPDLDDTAVAFALLHWGRYPVNADVFKYYEGPERFFCYPGEIDPSLSVNIRTLAALRKFDHPQRPEWIAKVLKMLRRWSVDGNFWFDKWHASPYYLAYLAVISLHGLADDVIGQRLKWLIRTQRRDGGWGYSGFSTPEETAYGLQALLFWDRHVERIDPVSIEAAARYLNDHLDDKRYVPLWIGKCLYTPVLMVRAVILAALHAYLDYRGV
jgi:halimadienyl-diphosphate synthase